jgi:dihydropteroate synthase
MKLVAHDNVLDLSTPKIMGILNVTPDSFYDGGEHNKLDEAIAHAKQMIKDGADIIDVGGESTRPGAKEVSTQEELDRVIPVIEVLSKETSTWISVDTSKPEVMQEAINAGAHMVNDIRALREPRAIEVCANLDVPVCLMHMKGQPNNMQDNPTYNDLLGDINQFFFERIHECLNNGIKRGNLLIDLGFGFGKTLEQNYQLLGRLDTFQSFSLPIVCGVSRKSMIGDLLNATVDDRLYGSLALALYSVSKGANIIRVHDIKETKEALTCWMFAEEQSHKIHKFSEIFKVKNSFKLKHKTKE